VSIAGQKLLLAKIICVVLLTKGGIMKLIVKGFGLTAALLFVTLPVLGHHSRALYDQQQVVAIEGIVTGYEWANPHVYLYLQSDDQGEGMKAWAFEGGVTAVMSRQGWTRDSFVAGDRVTVNIHPSRDPRREMGLLAGVEKGGVTLLSRSARVIPPPNAEDYTAVKADSIAGTWEIPGNPLLKLFSEPNAWKLTSQAQEAQAVYDDLTMNPQIQCIARTSPWVMIFTGVHSIEVGEETVSIRTEYDTVQRTIHMGVISHDGAVATHQGHSIGRWDGEALVVDTTHYGDHRSGNSRGVPSGSQKHLVERFELSEDRLTMTYSFELDDPENLAEPVTGSLVSTHRPDIDFSPISCDPDNASRYAGSAAGITP
jgi:hypothetical protein